MSLLFSHVTVKINDCTVRFFACGIPKEVSDLENYTAYNQFIEDICKNTEVNVHTDAYLYGDGDLNIATPTEIAYGNAEPIRPFAYGSQASDDG